MLHSFLSLQNYCTFLLFRLWDTNIVKSYGTESKTRWDVRFIGGFKDSGPGGGACWGFLIENRLTVLPSLKNDYFLISGLGPTQGQCPLRAFVLVRTNQICSWKQRSSFLPFFIFWKYFYIVLTKVLDEVGLLFTGKLPANLFRLAKKHLVLPLCRLPKDSQSEEK